MTLSTYLRGGRALPCLLERIGGQQHSPWPPSISPTRKQNDMKKTIVQWPPNGFSVRKGRIHEPKKTTRTWKRAEDQASTIIAIPRSTPFAEQDNRGNDPEISSCSSFLLWGAWNGRGAAEANDLRKTSPSSDYSHWFICPDVLQCFVWIKTHILQFPQKRADKPPVNIGRSMNWSLTDKNSTGDYQRKEYTKQNSVGTIYSWGIPLSWFWCGKETPRGYYRARGP